MPSLQSSASHAPVTFTVQEQHTPIYDSSSIVSTHYISEDTSNILQLHSTIDTSLGTYLNRQRNSWFRNGAPLSDSSVFNSSGSSLERLSLQVSSNNSSDIIGDYMGIVWNWYYDLNRDFQDMCRGYYSYLDDVLNLIPVAGLYWSIKEYGKSSHYAYVSTMYM